MKLSDLSIDEAKNIIVLLNKAKLDQPAHAKAIYAWIQKKKPFESQPAKLFELVVKRSSEGTASPSKCIFCKKSLEDGSVIFCSNCLTKIKYIAVGRYGEKTAAQTSVDTQTATAAQTPVDAQTATTVQTPDADKKPQSGFKLAGFAQAAMLATEETQAPQRNEEEIQTPQVMPEEIQTLQQIEIEEAPKDEKTETQAIDDIFQAKLDKSESEQTPKMDNEESGFLADDSPTIKIRPISEVPLPEPVFEGEQKGSDLEWPDEWKSDWKNEDIPVFSSSKESESTKSGKALVIISVIVLVLVVLGCVFYVKQSENQKYEQYILESSADIDAFELLGCTLPEVEAKLGEPTTINGDKERYYSDYGISVKFNGGLVTFVLCDNRPAKALPSLRNVHCQEKKSAAYKALSALGIIVLNKNSTVWDIDYEVDSNKYHLTYSFGDNQVVQMAAQLIEKTV